MSGKGQMRHTMQCRPRRTRARSSRALLATLAVAAMGAALPASASAIPFGANLARPPNNNVPCTVNPVTLFPWVGVNPADFQTCTWSYAGRIGGSAETFNVPAGRGVLTAARIRTGATTGPMQVVVFRSLRAPDISPTPPIGGIVCCTIRFNSQTFVPPANSVVTVPLPNVPVVNDRVLEPGLQALRFDTIALSTLAPNVPVPAHRNGDPNDLGVGFYPAALAGQERFATGITSFSGYVPLINAEWVPVPDVVGGAGSAGSAGSGPARSASREEIDAVQAQPVCTGGARAASTDAGGPAAGPVKADAGRPTKAAFTLHRVTASARQLSINQRIGQAAVRRANAIEAWLNAGIEGRDICGGALPAAKFGEGIELGIVDDAPAPTPPDPREVEVASGRSGGGKVTLSARQLEINQRIYQAAVRRANALEKRLDANQPGGGLTGGDIVDGSLGLADFAQGLGWVNASADAGSPEASSTQVEKGRGSGGGKVKLTAGQLQTNQRIAQAAVRRTNALIAKLERGLTAESFQDGSITGADLGQG